MSSFDQKVFTTYSKQLGRDPQICRDIGGHWVNERFKRCNNCFIGLEQNERGEWVERGVSKA